MAGASLLRGILSLRLLLLSPLISKDGQQLSIYSTAWGYEHEGQSWSSSRRMQEDFLFFSWGRAGVKQKPRVRESESERNGIMEVARHGLGRGKLGDGGPHRHRQWRSMNEWGVLAWGLDAMFHTCANAFRFVASTALPVSLSCPWGALWRRGGAVYCWQDRLKAARRDEMPCLEASHIHPGKWAVAPAPDRTNNPTRRARQRPIFSCAAPPRIPRFAWECAHRGGRPPTVG